MSDIRVVWETLHAGQLAKAQVRALIIIAEELQRANDIRAGLVVELTTVEEMRARIEMLEARVQGLVEAAAG